MTTSSFVFMDGTLRQSEVAMTTHFGFPFEYIAQVQSAHDYAYTARRGARVLFDVMPATEFENAGYLMNPIKINFAQYTVYAWARPDATVSAVISLIPFFLDILFWQVALSTLFYVLARYTKKYPSLFSVRNILVVISITVIVAFAIIRYRSYTMSKTLAPVAPVPVPNLEIVPHAYGE